MSRDLSVLQDYDWREVFRYAGQFGTSDVEAILGLREGENDGANWLMYGQLKDGRYFYLSAGCDYTGWDCQASGWGDVKDTLEELIRMGMDDEGREVFGLKVAQS